MNYSDKLDEVWQEAQLSIINNVREFGNDQEYGNEKVLNIIDGDEVAFNLDGGRWLKRLTETAILDNKDYSYAYGVLTHEQLCELADHINSFNYKPTNYYQPDFGDDDTLITPDGTELWSYYVYSTLDKAKEDFPDRKILAFSGDDIENPYIIK